MIMFDSVNVNSIPATAEAVAGYVGGMWPTWNALKARFPNLPALSIAVNASQDAQCLDVETGDATPADVPGWLDRMNAAHPGRTHIVYCPASWIPRVRAAAGNRRYLLWSAHYGIGQHLCGTCAYPAADATQFADTGPNGEHLDQTLMTPAFVAAIGGPPITTEADMQVSEYIDLMHQAADRSTPGGRQLGTYLTIASGVAGVQGQIAALTNVVQQLAASKGATLDTAAIEAATEKAIRNVLGSLDGTPA